MNDAFHCLVPTSCSRPATGTGTLSGRSFVAKDLFAVTGHVASFGSARWRDTHEASTSTAVAVDRMLGAGAGLEGMAKLDSLAYSLVGNAGEGEAPHNPRLPDRFTGGSSSGSAAAVAGGVADLGLGSDAAGSIRVPAAACGLCSIRPTRGSLDNEGMLLLAPSFDTVGLLAREPTMLRDAHAVLRGDTGAPPPPVTEVLLATDTLEWIDPDAADAVARAARELAARLGHTLGHTDLSVFTSAEIPDLFARLQGREIWTHHGAWVERNLDCFLDEVRVRLEGCRRFCEASGADQAADIDAHRAQRLAFGQVVGPGVCVVVPVLHDLPPLRTASDEDLVTFRNTCIRLTAPSSLAGAPEVVLPVRHRRTGNPYGVGLLGAPGADRSLLDAAVRAGADGGLVV